MGTRLLLAFLYAFLSMHLALNGVGGQEEEEEEIGSEEESEGEEQNEPPAKEVSWHIIQC